MLRSQGLFAEQQQLFDHDAEIRAQLKSALDRLVPLSLRNIIFHAVEDYIRASSDTPDFDHPAKEAFSYKFVNALSGDKQKNRRKNIIIDRIAHLVSAKQTGDIYIKFDEITSNADAYDLLKRLFIESRSSDRMSFKFAVVNRLIDCYHLKINDEKIRARSDVESAYLIDLVSQELGISTCQLDGTSEKMKIEQETEQDKMFAL